MKKNNQTIKFLLIIVSIITAVSLNVRQTGASGDQISIKVRTENFKKNVINGKKTDDELCKGIETYQKYVEEKIDTLNDELYNNDKLYKKLVKFPVNIINREVTIYTTDDLVLNDYIKFLKENGVKVGSSEGNIYLFQDPLFAAESFKNVLPEYIVDFYFIFSKDIEEGFQEDGRLMIHWDILRIKIIRLENYLKEFNKVNCTYIENLLKGWIHTYLESYLFGLPNGPELIDRNGSINPEAKKSFDLFLKENKNSKYHKLLERANSLLNKRKPDDIDFSLRDDRELFELIEQSKKFY